MPTRAQVTAASALSSTGAALLLAYLRASAVYNTSPGAYPTLEDDLTALVGVNSTTSKAMTAILDALEASGPDGAYGIQGGRDGVRYSVKDEREQLLSLALSVLYDTALAGTGANQLGAISAQMIDPACKIRCPACSHPWFDNLRPCGSCGYCY